MNSEQRRLRLLWILAAIFVNIAIGALDAATGVDLSVQILYLAPSCFIAWKVGRAPALALSALGAGSWLAAEVFTGHSYSHPVFAASSTLTLFAFLAASSTILSAMKASFVREATNARVDHLSGLWNARAFHELAQREASLAERDGSSLTVAYLDLDDFKNVNDTLGHLRADDLLRTVARSLRASLRGTDIVGRLGGDEFAIVLPRTSKAEAEVILKRTMTSVVAATRRQGFSVSFSVGCVTARGAGLAFGSLLQAADRRMYEAKLSGKAALVVTEVPPERAENRELSLPRRSRTSAPRVAMVTSPRDKS